MTIESGTDAAPPCYVLTQGNGGAIAIAFEVDERADLETIARIDGAILEGIVPSLVIEIPEGENVIIPLIRPAP